MVITDLGVLEPDPASKELTLVALHPGIVVGDVLDATGWKLRVGEDLDVTQATTADELSVLRDLKERTRRAHEGQ